MNEAAQKLIAKAKRTTLEDQFLDSIVALGITMPNREYRFCARRWRFDFAWSGKGLAVEIEGGTWVRGGHVRGKIYEENCRKYNTAVLLGWKVLRFTGDQVKSLEAAQVVKEALER